MREYESRVNVEAIPEQEDGVMVSECDVEPTLTLEVERRRAVPFFDERPG